MSGSQEQSEFLDVCVRQPEPGHLWGGTEPGPVTGNHSQVTQAIEFSENNIVFLFQDLFLLRWESIEYFGFCGILKEEESIAFKGSIA